MFRTSVFCITSNNSCFLLYCKSTSKNWFSNEFLWDKIRLPNFVFPDFSSEKDRLINSTTIFGQRHNRKKHPPVAALFKSIVTGDNSLWQVMQTGICFRRYTYSLYSDESSTGFLFIFASTRFPPHSSLSSRFMSFPFSVAKKLRVLKVKQGEAYCFWKNLHTSVVG